MMATIMQALDGTIANVAALSKARCPRPRAGRVGITSISAGRDRSPSQLLRRAL
jgi:hypothetical protein